MINEDAVCHTSAMAKMPATSVQTRAMKRRVPLSCPRRDSR